VNGYEQYDAMAEREIRNLMKVWTAHGIRFGRVAVLLGRYGGLETLARYSGGPPTEGFRAAREKLGPNSTMEGMALRPKYAPFLTPEVLAAARRKLEDEPR
jgi:hypothetical protein